MSSDFAKSFDEWIKMIRSMATSFLQQDKELRIHKEKLSTLFKELKVFNQKTAAKKFSTTPPNATEMSALRAALTLLSSLSSFIESCKLNKMIDTIKNQEINYSMDFLTKFRNEFNKFIVSFKILPQGTCILDEHQLLSDHVGDCRTIVEVINTYISEHKDISPLQKNNLLNRLSQYNCFIEKHKSEDENNNEEEDNNRIISPEEYKRRIQVISNTFVNREDFQQNEKVGQGSFGVVYSGIQKSTKKVVAIKELKIQHFQYQNLKSLINEVSIMASIRHYGVLPLVGYVSSAPYWIVTEMMSGGSLQDRLLNNKAKPLDGTKLTIIALGVAYTMKYMHSKKFIHRDLKPDNILLDADDYPYMIDFGLSRLVPDSKDECMTLGIGSPVFMAPELFEDSDPYDNKVDVYSYGITLWMMLTGQRPYSFCKKQMQLIREVVNGTRPKLPPTAGALGSLIEKCWSGNPKARPSFETIVSIFETGEVFFPGTNKAQVNSYKNIYKKKNGEIQEIIVEEVPPEKVEEVDVTMLQTMLRSVREDESTFVIEKIERNIHNTAYVKKLLKSPKFLKSLLDASDSCESSEVAQKIINIFTGVLRVQKNLSEVYIGKVLRLFVKFGSTEMTEILDFMEALPPTELAKIKLNGNQLNKYACFLKHSDASRRIIATNILLKIIENNAYEEIDLLSTNLKEVISNIASSSSSIPELLLSSLKVAEKLLKFEGLHKVISSNNLFSATVSVFMYDQKNNNEIYKLSCQILTTLIETFKGKITEDEVKVALLSLAPASKTVCTNQMVNYVTSLTGLLQLKALYSEIEDNTTEDYAKAFQEFLANSKSDESIVLLLKFCYSLLEDEKTHKRFVTLAPTFLKCVVESKSSKSQKLIQSVATCCLIQSIDDSNINSILTAPLKSFIQTSLKSQKVDDESTLNALRLCSAFSSRRKGVEYLMNDHVIELVDFYLRSGNKTTVKLAIMTYSSFSAIYPGSEQIVANVPVIIKMVNNTDFEDLQPYISSFLANASISSEAAIECANNITLLSDTLYSLELFGSKFRPKDESNMMKNKMFVAYKIISTLINTVMCQNAIKKINNAEQLIQICKVVREPFCEELLGSFLDLFTRLARTQYGIEAMKKSKLTDFLKNKFNDMKPDDFRRALILRLLTINS